MTPETYRLRRDNLARLMQHNFWSAERRRTDAAATAVAVLVLVILALAFS